MQPSPSPPAPTPESRAGCGILSGAPSSVVDQLPASSLTHGDQAVRAGRAARRDPACRTRRRLDDEHTRRAIGISEASCGLVAQNAASERKAPPTRSAAAHQTASMHGHVGLRYRARLRQLSLHRRRERRVGRARRRARRSSVGPSVLPRSHAARRSPAGRRRAQPRNTVGALAEARKDRGPRRALRRRRRPTRSADRRARSLDEPREDASDLARSMRAHRNSRTRRGSRCRDGMASALHATAAVQALEHHPEERGRGSHHREPRQGARPLDVAIFDHPAAHSISAARDHRRGA